MNERRKPIWISHRGDCKTFTENTSLAFEQAVKSGFTHLETDLRITKDNHIVLCHDPSFKRLGGPPNPIVEMTKKEVQKITLQCGQHPIFFDDFINRFAGCAWVFDFKPEWGHRTIAAFTNWVKKKKAQEWIYNQAKFLFWTTSQEKQFIQDFPMAHLYAQKNECWRAGICALFGWKKFAGIKANRTYALPPLFVNKSMYQDDIVKFYHSLGAKIVAFLPKNSYHVSKALAVKVDEILFDHDLLMSPQVKEML